MNLKTSKYDYTNPHLEMLNNTTHGPTEKVRPIRIGNEDLLQRLNIETSKTWEVKKKDKDWRVSV